MDEPFFLIYYYLLNILSAAVFIRVRFGLFILYKYLVNTMIDFLPFSVESNWYLIIFLMSLYRGYTVYCKYSVLYRVYRLVILT